MDIVSSQLKLAVLIDADNAQPALADALLAEIAKYGIATVKRAYGDWTLPNLGGWKKTLAEHAIQPIQQFRNTVGKNASDSALIIDAMDLLYADRLGGFCIVSSDSDFTRLASRIRETGLLVYGFGERKTPQAFVSACDKFVYVDVLRGGRPAAKTAPVPAKPKPKPKGKSAVAAEAVADKPAEIVEPPTEKTGARSDPALRQLLAEALDDAADDDGWAGLGAVGSLVAKRAPDFDPRNYGYKKLSDLITALGLFQIEKRGADGKPKAIYLRDKRPAEKTPA
ncbi:MAG: NYN domain-containing protein [Nevskia sp.]